MKISTKVMDRILFSLNMKHPTGRWLAIALGVFLFSFQTFIASASIIVDHTCTDLTKVPQNWVETAKSNLHIAYGHTSHGSQVTDGMTWLVEFINNGGLGLSYPSDLFAWNNGGTDGALDLHDYAMGGDVGYYPDWVNNTRDYLGDPDPETGRGTAHPNVNVIIWSWCGQVSGYSEQTMIANYLTPMSTLETEYPGIKFVYMTGHLDGTGSEGNLNVRNNQIRNYCRQNNKILYDFADIESYDPDGQTHYMPLLCNDNCDYDSDGDSSLDKNWAIDWQNSHTQNVGWYDRDDGGDFAHTQPLNANRKAYAAWWLWARLAGWGCTYSISPISAMGNASGGSGSISITATSGCAWTAISSDTSWITITSGSSGTGSGTVTYSVAANTTGSTRTGTMTIAGQTFTVTQNGSNAPLYFPHVDTNLPWQTEIAVINTSNQTVTGTLRGFSNGGQLIDTEAVTLSAHGRRQITVADEFTNHTNIGYIIFETDSAAVQGYTKFYKAEIYRAAIPAVKEVNTSDIYISHIASNAQWWTGISLVNTTSATKNLTMTFNNGQSRVITLTANQHQAFMIEPQPDIQSAVITNAGGVIGLELFGNNVGNNHLDGILLTDKTASTLYYPHVASDSIWWTGIVAYNPSELGCTITITPYSAQGNALTPSTRPIAGKEKYIGLVSDLGLPAGTAWFKIDSTRPLSGFELFGTVDDNQLAAYAGGGGTGAKSGVFAKIEKNGGWTGIAFVNTEESAASVTLTAYNDNGTVVATRVLPVGGHAKEVNLAEAIFPQQDISGATYIAYSSDRNVVGFQLNGTSDGMMLDGLPAFVLGSISKSYRYVGALVPGWHWGYGQGFWSKAIDDDLIQSAKDNSITVFHLMLPLFEKQLGIYNEEELAKLDHFLDSASRIGIYVMISFINIFGDLAMQTHDPYYNPTGIEGLMYDEKLKSAFKNRIIFLINRKNTINGRIYKEDPTISAWIIGDEPISAPFNYPVRPPDLTVMQFSTWLEEMAFYIKSLDQNHFVTINITPAQSSLKGGDWMQSVNVPSLDFIYAEDADMRILNYFWANAAEEYSLRWFTLNKPVVFSLSFSSGEWNQSIICKDYSFQAQLLGNAINRYFEVRATGVLVQTWGSDLYSFVPSFDQCFNYTDSNVLISGVLKGAASNLNQ